jgi:hypothetical protein
MPTKKNTFNVSLAVVTPTIYYHLEMSNPLIYSPADRSSSRGEQRIIQKRREEREEKILRRRGRGIKEVLLWRGIKEVLLSISGLCRIIKIRIEIRVVFSSTNN